MNMDEFKDEDNIYLKAIVYNGHFEDDRVYYGYYSSISDIVALNYYQFFYDPVNYTNIDFGYRCWGSDDEGIGAMARSKVDSSGRISGYLFISCSEGGSAYGTDHGTNCQGLFKFENNTVDEVKNILYRRAS